MATDLRSRRRDEGRALLLHAAQERYLRGERIEISTLASEHGISRASAYRWLGDNDRLLSDVLVSRARENFETQRKRHAGRRGRARILAMVHGFLHHAGESEHFDALLRREPQRALKLVASGAYGTQPVVVALFQELLEEEVAAGHLQLAIDAHTMAYAMVRLFEAFLYADIVAGEEQDLDRAVDLVGLLLPERVREPA